MPSYSYKSKSAESQQRAASPSFKARVTIDPIVKDYVVKHGMDIGTFKSGFMTFKEFAKKHLNREGVINLKEAPAKVVPTVEYHPDRFGAKTIRCNTTRIEQPTFIYSSVNADGVECTADWFVELMRYYKRNTSTDLFTSLVQTTREVAAHLFKDSKGNWIENGEKIVNMPTKDLAPYLEQNYISKFDWHSFLGVPKPKILQ